jgi:TetR/AcrR family transcriptional regulator, cholesterol catabolism regulator
MQNEEYSADESTKNSAKIGEKSAKSREKKSGGKKALGQEEDSRRNELIAKSAQLFREKGYEKTTVRDIAAAVGMQAGSWFYHFKSKQEILLAIMEQGMQQSLAEIEKIASQDLPPRAMFRELVQAHLNTLLAPNHDFITVILYEGRSLDAEGRAKVAALTNQYQAVWEKVIVALHESGDWALPGKLDRLLLFGSLNWTAQWYRGGVGLSVEQLAEHAVSFLLRT